MILSRLVSINWYSVLNIGIVFCTFIEPYVFPFGIIKWMIIVTKYGSILKLFKGCDVSKEEQVKSLYQYSLQLNTCCVKNCNRSADPEILSHVSVIMEIDCGRFQRIQLSYCGQDCQKIPPALWKMYGAKTQYLDLSYNSIETLKGLGQFVRLEELILDNNKLGDAANFPRLPCLRTLSLNNNQITDLEGLINKLSECFPALTYLSLLSNKACPNQLSDADKDESDYQRYRYFVIHKLPNLRFLDSRRISASEHAEARKRGEFARVRRPPAPRCDVIALRPAAAPVPSLRRPLPVNLAALGKHKGAYGKCHYTYTGKHSEGNRFIVNSDL